MALMSLEAEIDGNEQALPEHPKAPFAGDWPSGSVRGRALSADAGSDFIRARMPAQQERPAADKPVVDSPPLHGEQDAVRADEPRGSLLRRQPFAIVIGILLLISTVVAGFIYWDYVRHFESTDDAFIEARAFTIEPKVTGYITAVPVTDNQHVAAGDVIARLDDRDYRLALDQADAQLAHDQALLEQAEKNLGRYQFLVQRNAASQQQADDQGFLVEQDKSTVALDRANIDTAQLNLSHTTVTADQAGRVVNLTAAVGQFAQAGTTLTMLVPDEIWVTANFKETQLDAMRPGQPVTLGIDAYPERTIRGHVASVQPGSGTAFSLLPPQNATGNYVKIVQRVPVKIVLDNSPADIALGPGMSVVPTVRIDPAASLYERLRGWL
jgi:membrane fusion protein, multidrug efflux system